MSISRALYIDDRDPAITYSSVSPTATGRVWRPFTGASEEFMQTTTHANQTGAMASILFTGSIISVFGTVSPASTGFSDPLTHYLLDSYLPLPFRPIPNNDTQYNVTFYQSPRNLPAGLHTLQIVLQSVGDYWLDYMVIDGSPATLSADVNQTVITSAEAQSTHTTTQSLSPTLLSSTTASSTPRRPIRMSGELIAGAVLGCILGFALLFGLIVLIRRRKPRNHFHDSESTLTPFDALTREAGDTARVQTSEFTTTPYDSVPSRLNKRWQILAPVLHLEPPPVYYSPRI